MRRREFITLFGAATAAWPLAAQAQQGERDAANRRADEQSQTIGDKGAHQGIPARHAAMGWTDGRKCAIDILAGAAAMSSARKMAAELVALSPDVILSSGVRSEPLQQIRAIPIVFAIVPDPVGAGFVDSLARPGGNVTGFMQFEYGLSGKWVELLKEIAPGVTRAAVLRDPAISGGVGQFGAIQAVAPSLGVEVSAVNVRDAARDRARQSRHSRATNGGLIVTAGALAERPSRSDHYACGPA